MLTKNQLKRMFLRVLYEIEEGKMKFHNPNINAIIPGWINEYFSQKLNDEEIQLAYEAVQELRTSSLIVRDATQHSDDFVKLTGKGKKVVKNGKDPDIYGLQLEQLIVNPDILNKCLSSFNEENYEAAIFSAYRFMEEEVRRRSGLDVKCYGDALITQALHPTKGLLTITTCMLDNEKEGVYNLFKGAVAFFKNPSSHRTVKYEDKLIAMEIIGFADLLLQILSTAQLKTAVP